MDGRPCSGDQSWKRHGSPVGARVDLGADDATAPSVAGYALVSAAHDHRRVRVSVVRLSIAVDLPFVFCATCGVAFIERQLIDEVLGVVGLVGVGSVTGVGIDRRAARSRAALRSARHGRWPRSDRRRRRGRCGSPSTHVL